MTPPVVHLVGAGPGDVRLLTRRAADLLARADVVVLDRPSLDSIASLAEGAERIHVGRLPGQRAWSTAATVALLVERARAGLLVVRLKGGDPFVCSRGGEEALALRAQGIDVQVTPGVTAATAAPLAAGIPPGPAVTLAAGNHDAVSPPVGWTTVGAIDGAVVVLIGRSHQGAIADGLIAGGRPAVAPAALVHAATRVGERIVSGALGEVAGERLDPPATLVVAPVPSMRGDDRAHP